MDLGVRARHLSPRAARKAQASRSQHCRQRLAALRVPGDWTFGAGVTVVGDVTVEGEDTGKPVLVAEWLTRILAV